jgi:heme/copper-type cytochrome/quinol oxidase subunit 2
MDDSNHSSIIIIIALSTAIISTCICILLIVNLCCCIVYYKRKRSIGNVQPLLNEWKRMDYSVSSTTVTLSTTRSDYHVSIDPSINV